MRDKSPLDKSLAELDDVVEKLRSDNSPVGIDAVYTHAVIIDFLRQLGSRLDAIEARLDALLDQQPNP